MCKKRHCCRYPCMCFGDELAAQRAGSAAPRSRQLARPSGSGQNVFSIQCGAACDKPLSKALIQLGRRVTKHAWHCDGQLLQQVLSERVGSVLFNDLRWSGSDLPLPSESMQAGAYVPEEASQLFRKPFGKEPCGRRDTNLFTILMP
jgi:hypothetical protein